MKLWVVQRAGEVGYDEFDSWLVSSETAKSAIRVSGYDNEKGIAARCVGEALPDAVEGAILMDSFNAG